MKLFHLFVFRFQLILYNLSLDIVLASLCVAFSVICIFYVHPRLKEDTAALKEQYKKFSSVVHAEPISEPTIDEKNFALFFSQLGEQGYVEQQVKTIFANAEKQGLEIKLAEYKPTYNKDGKFFCYQIAMPLKGNYVAIRNFTEEILLNLPFAGLDEISIKRETINTPLLEVKLKFSLYLHAPKKIEVDR